LRRQEQSPGLLEEDNAYVAPGLFRPDDPPYSIKERVQPYFKLHGSSHWRALNGLNLLIMAENKGTQIDGVALLNWYRSEFRTRLSQPDARLMIVGYSFRDPHINEILWSSTKSGLKLFIVDVAGLRPLEEAPKINGHASTLLDDLRDAIIGGSRRSFSSSIATDHIERSKIQRFFARVHPDIGRGQLLFGHTAEFKSDRDRNCCRPDHTVGSNGVSTQSLPQTGFFAVSAGDFREILVRVAIFGSLETGPKSSKSPTNARFLPKMPQLSLVE
jgi:hypothetical protein